MEGRRKRRKRIGWKAEQEAEADCNERECAQRETGGQTD